MTDPVPFARGGAYPPRPGNAARPLVDGEPAFRRIAAAVEAARASVWVTVAFVERDLVLPGARGTFFDLLERAAARGGDENLPATPPTLPPGSSGPAAPDVHHNFVQRGNEGSERDRPDGAWPDAARAGRLPFPAALSPPAGSATVQITRTVRAGC